MQITKICVHLWLILLIVIDLFSFILFNSNMKPYECIIIGGGPAGLFCGAGIKRPKGGRVLLLEKNRTLGKKLLISGSGRCNITHSGTVSQFLKHYHEASRFMKPSLSGFTNSDLIDFLNKNGIPTVEMEGGKVFPESMSSGDILKLLLDKCGRNGCEIKPGEDATSVTRKEGLFRISTSDSVYETPLLVIATGGKSYPATGSSGDGYRFLESLGHPVTTVSPALTPFFIKDYKLDQLSGISIPDSDCCILREGKAVAENRGDLLFTHRGLSGPAVLDIQPLCGRRRHGLFQPCIHERGKTERRTLSSARARTVAGPSGSF